MYVTVRNRSIVFIKGSTYSVPSRLIGAKLKAKIYENKIDLCSGNTVIHSMSKTRGGRKVVINYRHIVSSLLKKPAAFSNYKYKEELYPTENFKKAYPKGKMIFILREPSDWLASAMNLKVSTPFSQNQYDVMVLIL